MVRKLLYWRRFHTSQCQYLNFWITLFGFYKTNLKLIRCFLSFTCIFWYIFLASKSYFENRERRFFSSQKCGKAILVLVWNAMFIDYWKVNNTKFSKMGSTVYFNFRSFIERWHLPHLFELSMIFRELANNKLLKHWNFTGILFF